MSLLMFDGTVRIIKKPYRTVPVRYGTIRYGMVLYGTVRHRYVPYKPERRYAGTIMIGAKRRVQKRCDYDGADIYVDVQPLERRGAALRGYDKVGREAPRIKAL